MVAKEVLMVRVKMAVMGPVVEGGFRQRTYNGGGGGGAGANGENAPFPTTPWSPTNMRGQHIPWPGWGTRAGDGGQAYQFHNFLHPVIPTTDIPTTCTL